MDRNDFRLGTSDTGPLGTISTPPLLRVGLECHTPLVAQGDEVLTGTRIARSTRAATGDLHSGVSGTVETVTPTFIQIRSTGTKTVEREQPPADAAKLVRWLSRMGMNTGALRKAPLLIVNAVPPEPRHGIFAPLMNDNRKAIELGLETIKNVVDPSRTVLAAAKGTKVVAFADCTVTFVPPRHPHGLAPMVVRAVTGEEPIDGKPPQSACIVTLEDLYIAGRIVESGRPYTNVICQLGKRAAMVPLGTLASTLLAEEGVSVKSGDRVVFGGLLTGVTACNLEQGTDKKTSAIHVIPEGLYPPAGDSPCVGCGECARRCPSRVRPDLLSKASEFKLFERCEGYNIFSCMECGICGYFCPVRRPILQYIRLAKQEINILKGACEIEEAPAS